MAKRRTRVFFQLVGLVVVDQIVKWWAVSTHIGVRNRGVFLGILPGTMITIALFSLWLIMALILQKYQHSQVFLPYGLILAGGLSNLIDRLIYGAVIDMIHYPIVHVYGNMADIFIVIGCIWLISLRKIPQLKRYPQ